MTKHKLNVICLSLASLFAVACGDPAAADPVADTDLDAQDEDTGLDAQDENPGLGGQGGDEGFGGAGGDGDAGEIDEDPVAPEDKGYHLTVIADGGDEVSLSDAVSYPGGDTEDVISYSVDRRFELGWLEIRAFCDGEGEDSIEFHHSYRGETFNCDPTGVLVAERLVGPDIPGYGTLTITALGGEGTYVEWILEGVVKPY